MVTIWHPVIETVDGTKCDAIVSCLERDIANGILKPNDQLPPIRKLAKRLAVTAGTIGRAYDAAEKKGLIQSHVGRGSFVCSWAAKSSRFCGPHDSSVDLGINIPPLPDSIAPFSAGLIELGRREDVTRFYGTAPIEGDPRVRQVMSTWLRKRMTIESDRLLVCSGTQAGLVSVLSATTTPGSRVLVEEKTFPGMIAAANLLKLDLVPVPMDRDGLIPGELSRVAVDNQVLYTIPTQHNPTAVTMPFHRRQEIANIATAKNLTVIEDDAYGMLMHDSPPPLATFAPDNVVWLMSISKVLAEGMRLAWLVVPTSLHSAVLSSLRGSSFFAPPLLVELASHWIEQGTVDVWLDERRKILERRRTMAVSILSDARIESCVGGTHLWLELPPCWTATDFHQACLDQKIIVFPASRFAPSNFVQTNHIRIAFGAVRNEEEFSVALEKISTLLKSEPTQRPAVY